MIHLLKEGNQQEKETNNTIYMDIHEQKRSKSNKNMTNNIIQITHFKKDSSQNIETQNALKSLIQRFFFSCLIVIC